MEKSLEDEREAGEFVNWKVLPSEDWKQA